MPSNAIWGEGGAQGGGSAAILGTEDEATEGARVNVDGTPLERQFVIGEGGAVCGGSAEVS